ncbi:hypothetical protein HZA75_07660 [Candidatus Roizmanbacteria bacterium]|nr:hypothetical protein [Candidatus Roizmanbacteria bacterium]
MSINDKILEKIEQLIDGQSRLEEKFEHLLQGQTNLEDRQGSLEKGFSRLETRQNVLEEEIKDFKVDILQAIKISQEDTIESLSEVINHGYNMHEERIVRLEDHLNLPVLKQ